MKTIEITDQNFEETIKNNKLVLVDFWAEWCGPCRVIAPVLEEVAAEYSEQAIIGKLNVDENSSTTIKFNVRGIPTLLLFKDGELIDKHNGVPNKGSISALINKHI